MKKEPAFELNSRSKNPYFDLEVKTNDLYRKDTLEMCIAAGTGHVTSCMCCAEILTALYDGGLMKHDPKNPGWKERDRFILSKGQASPILYVVLAHQGYFPLENIWKFVKGDDGKGTNAPFGVHLQCTVPGVEFTTGSLGHGMGYGIGMAKAAKIDGRNNLVYVLLGDGELYEGSNWEAAYFAPHHNLNNLVAIVDRNRQCTNGYTEKDILKMDSIGDKFRSFNWDVKEVNGHSIAELIESMKDARNFQSDKPLAVIANTEKGQGIKSLIGRMYFHGIAPKGKDIEITRKDLQEFTDEHKRSGGYDDV